MAILSVALVVAIVGKFAGAYIGARASRLNNWEALALGAGMNSRGVVEVIIGMIGLQRVADVLPPDWDRKPILDELKWGNQYFLKMQDKDGYVMDYCGGDDGNHWTDNKTGTAVDRKIHTEPAALVAQFHFIAAQAALARLTRADDAEYARGCDHAGAQCLKWCMEKRDPGAATSLSSFVSDLP